MERHDGGKKGWLSRDEFRSASQDIFKCAACAAPRMRSRRSTPCRACATQPRMVRAPLTRWPRRCCRLRRNVARGISKQVFAMVVLSPVVAYYTRKLVDHTIGRIFPALGALRQCACAATLRRQ